MSTNRATAIVRPKAWVVALAILSAAPLPAAAQQVWFDPDIPAGEILWPGVPSDDTQVDEAAPAHSRDAGPAATASLHAPHQLA
jgi:hypothetical protein